MQKKENDDVVVHDVACSAFCNCLYTTVSDNDDIAVVIAVAVVVLVVIAVISYNDVCHTYYALYIQMYLV